MLYVFRMNYVDDCCLKIYIDRVFSSFQFSSVTQSCLTLCDPMNHSTPGLPVHHQLLEFTQTRVHRVGGVIQPSHPLLSPSPSDPILPSIRVFSNESNLCMRWRKYWSFSFSISPSNEHPGMISFRGRNFLSQRGSDFAPILRIIFEDVSKPWRGHPISASAGAGRALKRKLHVGDRLRVGSFSFLC